jgi:succinate-semialdehyde dehydrogenase/glutarate-semialdehyde dehydrogenase
VLKDPRVVAATLTGSEPAGSSVAGIAGKQIKKTVLELGGSDPFIVMPSADLKEAVSTAVKARTINNGQSCIAAKRFVVAAEVYSQFEKKFVEEMKALRVGDPLEETTDIGPLATPQIVADLEEQVKKAVASGARILTAGSGSNVRETSTSRQCSSVSIRRHPCRAKRSLVRSRCCSA